MIRAFYTACLLALAPAPALATSAIDSLSWLEGAWEGPGIDGASAQEVYSRAAGGQIAGHFLQLKPDGSVMFYELIQITEREGKLVYRLKHFNPDLTGWEEKGQVREFPLSRTAPNVWEFSGLTMKRHGRNRMTATVVIKSKAGKDEVLTFAYRRRH